MSFRLIISRLIFVAFVVVSAIGGIAFAQNHNELVAAENNGDANALNKLGTIAELQNNYSLALDYYSKAASLGDTDALVHIGQMYESGSGLKQDYPKALEYFTKSANLGNSYALYKIGSFYENGSGIKQDYIKAMQYYQKAASLSDAHAMLAISNMYYLGKGVPKNRAKADKWYDKSQIAFAGYKK